MVYMTFDECVNAALLSGEVSKGAMGIFASDEGFYYLSSDQEIPEGEESVAAILRSSTPDVDWRLVPDTELVRAYFANSENRLKLLESIA